MHISEFYIMIVNSMSLNKSGNETIIYYLDLEFVYINIRQIENKNTTQNPETDYMKKV